MNKEDIPLDITRNVLREGFTTGSCAAAAALASCIWQKYGECPQQVEIVVPEGRFFRPEIIKRDFPQCGVIKDAGDDPDITNGMEIIAWVTVGASDGEVTFGAGEGVGMVTLPGLKVPVGEPAINPVPRQMITEAVRSVYPTEAIEVTVSVPGGAETAKKTFNPRLGIEGGLSILGTTGIVRPMSEDAIRETIRLELLVHRARGEESIVLTFGSQGEKAVLEIISNCGVVQMSNYVGFSLDTVNELGFKRVLIAGHAGKLVKLAAGVMQTHSNIADVRREVIVAYMAMMGAKPELLRLIMNCVTTDAALPIIESAGYSNVWSLLAEAARGYCEKRVRGEMRFDILFLGGNNGMLGANEGIEDWIGGKRNANASGGY